MKLKKGDFFIIIAVILLAAAIWGFGLPERDGERVGIYADGKLRYTLSLSEERQVEVEGCTVKIENGAASVVSASCPDKVCVRSGKISKAGEIIMCVPNRVSVKIDGDAEFDARVN